MGLRSPVRLPTDYGFTFAYTALDELGSSVPRRFDSIAEAAEFDHFTSLPALATGRSCLGLTKDSDGNVTINGVRHAPIQMSSSPTWTASYAKGESLNLTTRLFGQWNRIAPDEPLVTNPECN